MRDWDLEKITLRRILTYRKSNNPRKGDRNKNTEEKGEGGSGELQSAHRPVDQFAGR